MEKYEAERFVIQRLNLGDDKKEIAVELSQLLGAPTELVKRFVDQVSKSQQQLPSTIHEEFMKSDLESLSDDGAIGVIEGDDSPYLYDEPLIDEAENIESSPHEKEDNIIITKQKPPDDEDESGTAPHPNKEEQLELESFVLQSLKKHRRQNDIVQVVCERTGWSWNKAQLFVARTQTRNHHELTKRNRLFMIPFSGIFIIGGILLLLWSVLALFDYYNGYSGQGTSTLPLDFIVLVIAGLLTSFGIIAGGIYGLYCTLTSQRSP